MTDRQKNETLAKQMGYEIVDAELPVAWRGIVIHNTNPTILGNRDSWWNPLRNVADAMEIYQYAARSGLHPQLIATYIDGAMICRLDLAGEQGPECSTIPSAISEAMIAWLEEQ